jgi:hypothetical protein
VGTSSSDYPCVALVTRLGEIQTIGNLQENFRMDFIKMTILYLSLNYLFKFKIRQLILELYVLANKASTEIKKLTGRNVCFIYLRLLYSEHM